MSSSDGYISVHYGATNDVYDGLVQATSQINTVIGDLESVINRLMGTWQGISQEAWTAIQQGWNNRIAKMNEDLAANTNTLSEMTANYANTDNNLAAQWENIALS